MNRKPSARKVARDWMDRQRDPHARKVNPTQALLLNLRLPVSEDRFDRAMVLVARDIGGSYNKFTGAIHLPSDILPNLPFTELKVLYRKFPCGMLIKNPEDPGGELPCISFDVIPNVNGDPRHSKFYRSFQGDASTSKRLFNQFVGWLAILCKAIKRYREQLEAGHLVSFRMASVERVAAVWLLCQTHKN